MTSSSGGASRSFPRNRAAVEWWAALTDSGELVTLAGTSWLTFGDDGRVVEQHDYWTSTPGRAAPWDGLGR